MAGTASSSGSNKKKVITELVPRSDEAPYRFAGYARGEELGRGAFACVYACRRESDGERFAAKAVDLKRLRLSVDVSREMKKLLREAKILKKVPPHPNLVRFYDVVKEGEWLYFLLELVAGGNLFNTLVRRPGKRPKLHEAEARYVCRQLVDGLALLHDQDIIHRDLKLENVLVAQERSGGRNGEVWLSVKIADFGLSKVVGERYSDAQSLVGSPRYMAPEVLAKGVHDFRADLWSLGVLMHVLLDGRFPCDERAARVPQNKLDDCVGNLTVSAQARAVVLGLLQLVPKKRTTMEKLQRDPWLGDDSRCPDALVTEVVATATKSAVAAKPGAVTKNTSKDQVRKTTIPAVAKTKITSAAVLARRPTTASATRPRPASAADAGSLASPSAKRPRLRYKQPPVGLCWSVGGPIIQDNGFPPFGRDEELAIESAVSEVEQAVASPQIPRKTVRRPALSR